MPHEIYIDTANHSTARFNMNSSSDSCFMEAMACWSRAVVFLTNHYPVGMSFESSFEGWSFSDALHLSVTDRIFMPEGTLLNKIIIKAINILEDIYR